MHLALSLGATCRLLPLGSDPRAWPQVLKPSQQGASRGPEAPAHHQPPTPAPAHRPSLPPPAPLPRADLSPLFATDPPEWVPDEACGFCTACKAPFTVIRRKHHCRSCGKIFCSRCSSHSAPLPRYGQVKPVRVCTHCYMFHVTPFYSDKAGI